MDEDLQLKKLIKRCKVEKGEPYTHTSIGEPKVSLNISDTKTLNTFYKLIHRNVQNGNEQYFVEKPLNPSPLRVDLDFRFSVIKNEYGEPNLKRDIYYTREHVMNIVKGYYETINDIYNIETSNLRCYVMEKPSPKEDTNIIKDGIHIVFPDLVIEHTMHHYIRNRIIDRANVIFGGIYPENDYKNIIDKSIIDSNSWQIYNCQKPKNTKYKLTGVYNFKDNNVIEDEDEYEEMLDNTIALIQKLSMRKTHETHSLHDWKIRENRRDMIENTIVKSQPNNKKKMEITNSYILELSDKTFVKNASKKDLDLAKRIVLECLDLKRADDYDDWMKVGWALRNIDDKLLHVWIEFSKNSSKFNEQECINRWEKMKEQNMGMGTLIFYAKEDNESKYRDIYKETLTPLIDECIINEGLDSDMADLIYAMYENDYKCIGKDEWFYFSKKQHRWVYMPDGMNLSDKISREISQIFVTAQSEYIKRQRTTENPEESKNLQKKADKAIKVHNKCKTHKHKTNMIKEAKIKFYDENFNDEIDSRGHLLGFTNGVYDLKAGITYKDEKNMDGFRDGMPNDYITKSTKCKYVPYDPKSEKAIELDNFLSKILPKPKIKKYLMYQFAYMIDGTTDKQNFFMLSGKQGSGSNGKTTLTDKLMKSALGDYWGKISISYFTQGRGSSSAATPELAELKGVRFACVSEPESNDIIHVGKMKEITGGDTICSRKLYKEPSNFKPQCTWILSCNFLPKIEASDGGSWRRIKNIQFISKFTDNPNPNNPYEFETDHNIEDKIERIKETFISYLIYLRVNMDKKRIREPPEVLEATRKYELDSNIVRSFIVDKVEDDVDVKYKLNIRTLWNEFKSYHLEQKNQKTKMEQYAFKSELEKEFNSAYPSGGWSGKRIRISNDEDDDEDNNEENEENEDIDDTSSPVHVVNEKVKKDEPEEIDDSDINFIKKGRKDENKDEIDDSDIKIIKKKKKKKKKKMMI